MKKTLIITFLMLLMCTIVQAQSGVRATPVSKKDFELSVMKLKASVTQNKIEETKKNWEEVHELMLSEFAAVKSKVMAANEANDEPGKAKYLEIHNRQLALYREIFKAKDNLLPYRQQLFDQFASYVNTML
jgi:hypothetical protein